MARCGLSVLFVVAFALTAHSATLSGQVVTAAGVGVSHARVIALHNVPIVEGREQPNGLLGETYTDSAGHFRLQANDRASLDFIVAGTDMLVGGVRPPFSRQLRIVMHAKKDPPWRRLRQQQRSPQGNTTPNQAMKRIATD